MPVKFCVKHVGKMATSAQRALDKKFVNNGSIGLVSVSLNSTFEVWTFGQAEMYIP